VLLKDKELSQQLTSGTYISTRIQAKGGYFEQILRQYESLTEHVLNFNMVTSAYFATFSNVCVSQGSVATHLKCDGN